LTGTLKLKDERQKSKNRGKIERGEGFKKWGFVGESTPPPLIQSEGTSWVPRDLHLAMVVSIRGYLSGSTVGPSYTQRELPDLGGLDFDIFS
jgi:hypothetical protein